MPQQDSNQTGENQNPEGMVEDAKEPQEGGVTAAPGDVENQGAILNCVIICCYHESRGGSFDLQLRAFDFREFLDFSVSSM